MRQEPGSMNQETQEEIWRKELGLDIEAALWPRGMPTALQRLWGNMFLALWHLVDSAGRGVGRTWFWKHVIAFIELQDPEVRS